MPHRRAGLWSGTPLGRGHRSDAAAAAGILLTGGRPDLPTDPNLLAIAPFDVLDPSLQIWHEGLVDILSRNLDGAGPLRTVPQTVGLKRWQGRADRVSAESFGHRTGAGLVVFGSVRKTRDTRQPSSDGAGPGPKASRARPRGQR